jgi:hypothetical protein
VYRPTDPAKFNGTVYVEWLNVSAAIEYPADWVTAHLEIMREGAAWVGVSAQAIGIEGGTAVLGRSTNGIKAAAPERYGSLSHPGDSFSYDIFSQAGAAIRAGAVKPLGDLDPKRLIATGGSQSAQRLITYADARQRSANVYDGFLIRSRLGVIAPLTQVPLTQNTPPFATRIRDDLNVPVLLFMTETDLGPLSAAAASQPDTKTMRTWEVAGTSHADAYVGMFGFDDTGTGTVETELLDMTSLWPGPNCTPPPNAGPAYAVYMAAMSTLNRWVQTARPPPSAPRFQGGPRKPPPGSPTGVPFTLSRDKHGNAKGGIRTPFVDAPQAALKGDYNPTSEACRLYGSTTPFDAATLHKLYPTREKLVTKFERSTAQAVKHGYLLQPEADKLDAAINTL